jgi:tetratricopeptide (TPR) repeat protein
MELLAKLSSGETIALWALIVAAVAGIVVPVVLHFLKRKDEHSQHVDVGRINGDGTAIGNKPVVNIDKRQGIDGGLVLSKAIETAEAKGRAEEQIEQLKDELAKAVERMRKLEAAGNRPDAEKALEELRESGEMSRLQELLIKDRDEHRDALIQRNREIAAVSYLRGDIDVAEEAVNEILRVLPDDLFALNQSGHICRLRGKLNEAERAYLRVQELAIEASSEEVQAAALGNLGVIYGTRGDLNRAEQMIKTSLEIDKKLGRLEGMANQYGNLGLIYRRRGDLDKAEQMFNKSLEINEKLGRLEGMASQYGNLGLIYQTRGDLGKAEQMHNKSLEIEEKLGRLEGMASEYGNLGLIYRTRGDLDKAEQMHKKSLEINEKLGRLEGMANQYGNLGLIYQTRGDLDKAEQMHKKSLEINEKLGRLEGMASNYANLGIVYEQREDVEKARKHWEKAVGLFKKIGMKPEIEQVQGWIDGLKDK